jgi:hypothetical protein
MKYYLFHRDVDFVTDRAGCQKPVLYFEREPPKPLKEDTWSASEIHRLDGTGMSASDRTFVCPHCGQPFFIDADALVGENEEEYLNYNGGENHEN